MKLSLALTEAMDDLVVQLVIQLSFHMALICCMPSLSYGIPSNMLTDEVQSIRQVILLEKKENWL